MFKKIKDKIRNSKKRRSFRKKELLGTQNIVKKIHNYMARYHINEQKTATVCIGSQLVDIFTAG